MCIYSTAQQNLSPHASHELANSRWTCRICPNGDEGPLTSLPVTSNICQHLQLSIYSACLDTSYTVFTAYGYQHSKMLSLSISYLLKFCGQIYKENIRVHNCTGNTAAYTYVIVYMVFKLTDGK